MRWGRGSLENKQNLSWPVSTVMQSSHIPESEPLGSALQLMSQGSYSDGKWNWQESQPSGLGPDLCRLPASSSPASAPCCPLWGLSPGPSSPCPHSPSHFPLFFFFKEHIALYSYFPLCLPVYFLSLHQDLRTKSLTCLLYSEPLLGTEANTVWDSINMCRSENDFSSWKVN